MFRFFVVIQLLLEYTNPGETLRCFECNNVPIPIGCGEITICSDSEACVIEQIVTTSGNVIYNSGCESKSRCAVLSGRRAVTKRNSDIITCRECCDGPFCNNKGCGFPEILRPQRGVYCYDCPYLVDPQKCENVKICDSTEQCLTRVRIEHLGVSGLPDSIYASECQSSSACTTLETVQGGKCCDSDFCNDKYNDTVATKPGTPGPTSAPTVTVTAAQTNPKTQPSVVTTVTVVTGCDLSGGYTRLQLNNNQTLCVKVYEGPSKDWFNAKVACETENARLVVTNTAEKINELDHFLHHHSKYRNYWIGLWDKYSSNHFYWLTGEVLSANYWGNHPKQPNYETHGKDEDCVFIYNRYHWHDTVCSDHEGYVCERV